MTELVVGLAVVTALGVVLLAVHQVWFAIVVAGRPGLEFAEAAAPSAPPRAALYAVEALPDEPVVRPQLTP